MAVVRPIGYIASMTRDQVKEILDRVLSWPSSRQEDAARLLSEMEQQHASLYRLSDAQVDEIARRRAAYADGQERYASDAELDALWKKCGL